MAVSPEDFRWHMEWLGGFITALRDAGLSDSEIPGQVMAALDEGRGR